MNRWLAVGLMIGALAGCKDQSSTSPQPTSSAHDGGSASADGASTAESRAPTDGAAPRTTDGNHRPSDESAQAEGNVVELERITLTAPDAWVRKPAASSFVQAEFSLPRAEGDEEDGRLTVSIAGGSIEQNVERWRGQFGGQPEKASQETMDIQGFEVTVVDFMGEFNDQRGPFAPPSPKSGYRMLAAIIPVDGQLHFIKATGPQKTIGAHYDEFKAFVESLRKK